MKKVILVIWATIFFAITKTAFASSDFLCYYDFENVTTSAQQYFANTENISTRTTNYGLKSYDFYDYNGSTRLRFVGFTENEQPLNADSFFDFNFDEYTAEKYPDTKLVIGYDEINEYNNKDSYQRTVIQNDDNERMMQMYSVKSTTEDQYYYRPNNAAPYNRLNAGSLYKFKYVIDVESETVEPFINGTSKNVRSSPGVNSVSSIIWNPTKEEIFSIDNIYAIAVPNEFGVVSTNNNIDVEDGILNVKLTAPADETAIDKIKVYNKNEEQIPANITADFKNSSITISFPNRLKYNSEYTLSFESGFKDIAGNTLEQNVTFKTRQAYAYENDNILAYYDFENITTSAQQYFANTENISTRTTNYGLKSYDFYYYNGSTRLRFVGFTENEQPHNASRFFDFNFDEYTAEKYPDTKLVIGYDEINEYNNKDSYQRTVIQNDANKRMMQMYSVKSTTEDQYYYRPNNAAPYNRLNAGSLYKFKYVIDVESETVEPFINGTSKNVRSRPGVNSVSSIIWNPTKEEIFSIDNIYAVAVPNELGVISINNDIDVEDGILNVKLTAPVDETTIDKIKVYNENEEQITANITTDFKNSSIAISFPNRLQYDSEYTLSFEPGFKDIAGNTLEQEVKFNTEKSYSFDINATANDSGNDLQYEISAENLSNDLVDTYIVIALYDENGGLVRCSYWRQRFEPNETETISGTFKNAAGYTVEVFADDI